VEDRPVVFWNGGQGQPLNAQAVYRLHVAG
jgi:hypothetical protein